MRSLAALLVLVPAVAAADPGASPYAFGARVGGYGFRDPSMPGPGSTVGNPSWQECRMNGLGVFGQRALGRYGFTEVGLDFYQATADSVEKEHMDRMSGLATVAAGLRMFPRSIVSPYVQLGVGAELTRVASGDTGNAYLLPEAFLGAGGDLLLGSHLRLGVNLRMHVMGQFEQGSTDATPAAAAQVQFYAKYQL